MSSTKAVEKSLPDDSFERFLSTSLGEVEPDPEFVGHLRRRLTHKPEVELEKSPLLAAYFVIGAGLFSGALLFWLLSQVYRGARAFLWRK